MNGSNSANCSSHPAGPRHPRHTCTGLSTPVHRSSPSRNASHHSFLSLHYHYLTLILHEYVAPRNMQCTSAEEASCHLHQYFSLSVAAVTVSALSETALLTLKHICTCSPPPHPLHLYSLSTQEAFDCTHTRDHSPLSTPGPFDSPHHL